MMTPALIVLCMVAVYPVLRTFWLSLHEMNLKEPGTGYPFIGLANYLQIFRDARAMADILFTLKFTMVTVIWELLLGFAAALLMNQPFRGRGLVRASILVPWAIPTSVSAMMWKFIYNDQYGLFNDILYRLGVIPAYKSWLSTTNDTFLALVITDVWKTFPFMALLILAGLQMMPDELYESARLDGAGVFKRFRYITLPLMKRTLQAGEMLKVDTGCLVALSPTVNYEIEFVGGVKNTLFGGEGLFFATVTGPGDVWLQSLPFSRLAGRMAAASGGGKEEGSILGKLGGVLNGDND
jgi:ABC-type sugar transport system permease subunit